MDLQEFVLNESSASLSGHQNQALALDHFGMNKFEASDDSAYEAVMHQITEMAAHAQSMSASPLVGKRKPEFRRSPQLLPAPAPAPRMFEPTPEIQEMA